MPPAKKKITLKEVETCLSSDDWDIDDDRFRLALVYFVKGVLMSHEWKNSIREEYLSMVEDLDFFLNYPWGTECFEYTIASLKKDVKRKAQERKEKRTPPNQKETWTFYGFPQVLQFWFYEASSMVGKALLDCHGIARVHSPRKSCQEPWGIIRAVLIPPYMANLDIPEDNEDLDLDQFAILLESGVVLTSDERLSHSIGSKRVAI